MRQTITVIIGAVIGIIAMGIMISYLTSSLFSEQKEALIVNPKIEKDTGKTAVVWETREPANGILFYTMEGSGEEKREIAAEFTIAHRIELAPGAWNIRIRTCTAVNRCSEHGFSAADG